MSWHFGLERTVDRLIRVTPWNFFGPGNTGVYKTDDSKGINYIGNYVNEDTRPENAYTGTSSILAAYGMATVQVLPRLKVIGGLRIETTDLEVVSGNEYLPKGKSIQLIFFRLFQSYTV